MGYSKFIAIVNASAILVLALLAALLLGATKFRGENAYVAAIIVLTTIPVYSYNLCRSEEWYDAALWFAPFSFSVNTMLMPLLWLFTLKNLKTGFRLRPVYLLHFLPAVIFLILALCMPREQVMANIRYEMGGADMWLGDFNAIVVTIQIVLYFTAIFIYIHRVKKHVKENCSDAEFFQKEWIGKFMLVFAVLFVLVMVAYAIYPRTDVWLIQVFNTLGMIYLIYNTIAHPAVFSERCPNVALETGSSFNQAEGHQMEDTCHKVVHYLMSTKAYLRQDLSLAELSKETGLSQKMLSRSINGHMNQNFFGLINRMRVDEAKRLLLLPENSEYTIDSIVELCGFRSRSTFFLAFKRIEGQSPSQWLKSSGL